MSGFDRGPSTGDINIDENEDQDQTLFIVTNTGGYHWILTTEENRDIDHEHAQQLYPQLFVHSQTSPTTNANQWISIFHDTKNGSLNTGEGDLILSGASGQVYVSGALTADSLGLGAGDFDITGTLAVASDGNIANKISIWHDGGVGVITSSVGNLLFQSPQGNVVVSGSINTVFAIEATNGDQLILNHDGTSGSMRTTAGNLIISGASGQVEVTGTLLVANAATKAIIIRHDDANGIISTESGDLVLDSANNKVDIQAVLDVGGGINSTGDVTVTGSLLVGDGVSNIILLHDSTDGKVQTDAGRLKFDSDSGIYDFLDTDDQAIFSVVRSADERSEMWGLANNLIGYVLGVHSSLQQTTMAVRGGAGTAGGRQLVLTDYDNRQKDHDHPDPTNPTLFIHSQTDPDTDNTQWMSLHYGKTDGFIGAGAGNVVVTSGSALVVQDATDAARVVLWHDDTNAYLTSSVGDLILNSAGDNNLVHVSGALEIDQDLSVLGGQAVVAKDSNDTNSVAMWHDDTNANFSASSGDLIFKPATSRVGFGDGTGNLDMIIHAGANNLATVQFSSNATITNEGAGLALDADIGGLMLYVDQSFGGEASVILTDRDNFTKNHDHGSQQHPTLFIHSSVNPDTDNTQWMSLHYSKTDGFIDTGAGNVVITSGSALVIQDATDAATLAMWHDGTNARITSSLGNIHFSGSAQGGITVSGSVTSYFDDEELNAILMSHDGTDGQVRTQAGDLKLTPASGMIQLVPRIIKKTINFNDASPVTIATVQDGDMVTGMWAEVKTTWDGDGTVNLGDGNDTTGFLTDASLVKGSTGYKGTQHNSRGSYLWNSAGSTKVDYFYEAADTIDATIVQGTTSQGIMDVYVQITRLK